MTVRNEKFRVSLDILKGIYQFRVRRERLRGLERRAHGDDSVSGETVHCDEHEPTEDSSFQRADKDGVL